MSHEGEPTAEVHKGDLLLELFGMSQFAGRLIDVGDGQGAIHPLREYPYVTPSSVARGVIDGILTMSNDDPRRPVVIEAGRRELANRLGLVWDSKSNRWVESSAGSN